jgi:hypothetical protein
MRSDRDQASHRLKQENSEADDAVWLGIASGILIAAGTLILPWLLDRVF